MEQRNQFDGITNSQLTRMKREFKSNPQLVTLLSDELTRRTKNTGPVTSEKWDGITRMTVRVDRITLTVESETVIRDQRTDGRYREDGGKGQLMTGWEQAPELTAPIGPTRTSNNPGHANWKSMDRKTSYRTGCAWRECPNCESKSGLRRYYADGHEECDECGFRVPMKSQADRDAEKRAKLERAAQNKVVMAAARATLRQMVEANR